MADNILKFRTRGSSEPDKKPKIYFCCHTKDFEKYFESILDDILKSQNCSVWYMESISLPLDENTMFDLNQMQLFVVPVTYYFLTDDTNPAVEIFQYALKKHIPILPIMTEINLEYFYAKRFGSIQFLDRINNDPTAIPYSVKLSKFLSQVLIQDDMGERIRSAFHTYIFLSYRKKDRKFAHSVMKKIHENKFCERTAIWYDEFLVPGEKFNEEIKKTLEKSDLFSLVVTPNIVNEENYVMNVEYPMAQELNKPILPIEILPTDAAVLREHYLDIPEPVDFRDDLSLYDRLRNILPKAEDSTESDANSDFLIGQAYLSGIDVELNREKGVGLIEKAAEAGLEEAIRKLVDIYSRGIGSAQNYEKAYEWETRLVEKYETIADKSGTEKDIMIYLKELIDFIYLVDEGGDKGNALSLCEEAYGTSWKICTGRGKPIVKRILYVLKGNDDYLYEGLYYILKSSRFALKFSFDMDVRELEEKWLKRVESIRKVYEKMFDDVRISRELLDLYNDLADMTIKNEQYDKARHFIEKMAVILTDVFNTENPLGFRLSQFYQASICQKEGELAQAIGNLAQAHTAQQKCVDLLFEIAEEYQEETGVAVLLIRAQNRLGTIYCQEGDVENAQKWLSAAKKSIGALKDRGHDLEGRFIYAETMRLSGDIFFLKNDNENALQAYNAAYELFSEMTDNTMSAQIFRDLANLLLRIGCCYERLGRYEEAAEWYMKSNANFAHVLSFSKSVIDAQFQADACERLWNNAIYRGDYVLEKEWYGKLLFLREEVYKDWNNEDNKKKLNDLKSTRERLKKEGKIGSIDWDEPSNFVQYILNHSIEYDVKNQEYIEMEIGRLLEKYWQVNSRHMNDKTNMAFTRLTLILTKNENYYGRTKEDDIEYGKIYYGNIVVGFLMGHYNAFTKYDECVALIMNFCGYYCIQCAKRMSGGKKQAMKDYWNFYCDEPFWTMPAKKIQYPDLWKLIHSWIIATKHKYL